MKAISRVIISIIICSQFAFPDSNKSMLKPTVEEFKLFDTAKYKLGNLGIDAFKHIDSSALTELRFWQRLPSQPAQSTVSDSVRMVNFGYSFRDKVIPDFHGVAFDIYFKNKLISQNNVEVSSARIDTVVHSCLFNTSIYTPGERRDFCFFNDHKLKYDDLRMFHLSPELLNGKPFYLIRNSAINKSDSSLYFTQPPPFNGTINEPRPQMSYEFILLWGKEIKYRFKYPYSAYWHPFADQWGYKTLVMNNGWAFQILGKMIVNGVDISAKNGYSECFDSWKLNDKIFFFYKKSNYFGTHYADTCLPQKYDQIFHTGCCESSALNPRFYNDKAMSFFAVKDNYWYLVIVHF